MKLFYCGFDVLLTDLILAFLSINFFTFNVFLEQLVLLIFAFFDV